MDRTDEQIRRFKDRQQKQIDLVKRDLSGRIELQNGPVPADIHPQEAQFFGPYVEINAALLETAIDRMISLLGGADTRAFLLTAYDRRLAARNKTLI